MVPLLTCASMLLVAFRIGESLICDLMGPVGKECSKLAAIAMPCACLSACFVVFNMFMGGGMMGGGF